MKLTTSFVVGFFGVTIALICAALGYFCWFTHYVASPYEEIVRGNTEAQVIGLLGKPHRITGVPTHITWDGDYDFKANTNECVKEYWYEPPSITGEAYTVGFDPSGRVVSRYHYSSQ